MSVLITPNRENAYNMQMDWQINRWRFAKHFHWFDSCSMMMIIFHFDYHHEHHRLYMVLFIRFQFIMVIHISFFTYLLFFLRVGGWMMNRLNSGWWWWKAIWMNESNKVCLYWLIGLMMNSFFFSHFISFIHSFFLYLSLPGKKMQQVCV